MPESLLEQVHCHDALDLIGGFVDLQYLLGAIIGDLKLAIDMRPP